MVAYPLQFPQNNCCNNSNSRVAPNPVRSCDCPTIPSTLVQSCVRQSSPQILATWERHTKFLLCSLRSKTHHRYLVFPSTPMEVSAPLRLQQQAAASASWALLLSCLCVEGRDEATNRRRPQIKMRCVSPSNRVISTSSLKLRAIGKHAHTHPHNIQKKAPVNKCRTHAIISLALRSYHTFDHHSRATRGRV